MNITKEVPMNRLNKFLEEVEIKIITKDGRRLMISKFKGEVTFYISGKPNNVKRIDPEYCSPNLVADICMNHFSFPLTSEEVVEIFNWV
jgi:YbbR domain-containing protein